MDKYILPDTLSKDEKDKLRKSLKYWDNDRIAAAQNNLATKSQKEINKQLAGYYGKSMQKTIGQFEKTYNRVISSIADGATATPADLYKLNTYWEMQGQLRGELLKLGYAQLEVLDKQFTNHYVEAYDLLSMIDKGGAFNTVNPEMANQIINQIWCADGEAWSNKIWKNIDMLQQSLNDGLVDCLILGKKSEWLTEQLTEQFNISFGRAETLVKTELSHITTQAAKQRYTDMGATQFEVWAEKDERQCKICGKLHKTTYPIGAQPPIPAHPRCRCTIIPVID